MSTTPTPTETPSRASRPIMITTAVVGGFALLTVGSSAALAALSTGTSDDGSLYTSNATVDNWITGIDIDANAANFTLAYGDVVDATLEAKGPRASKWKLYTEGNDLKVESPSGFFSACLIGCARGGDTVTLTLPKELEEKALDVDASLGAGKLSAAGRFGDFDLDMSAGKVVFTGAARSLDVEMSAGAFSGVVAGVREASFNVSAGSAKTEITGVAPREVDVEVSAGSVDLTLPNEAYRVDTDVSAGSVNNKLRTDPTSKNLISAEVSAGTVTLRQGK
ncbi:DUF4097 domain-containing protein [Leucobacter viscericola]|uniref:DUF4097 domain-containing protein n=1 Tax=Leucobacter viscericola TaxID=2714935 RepID=A0A6G7XFJ1_9MICO|nr:DUF4097 family beta strand repeat-containing protein [Leucobacter viscericola]QIK63364.1 DUF4097 domain-containing protein [Leucobacter viscericola]